MKPPVERWVRAWVRQALKTYREPLESFVADRMIDNHVPLRNLRPADLKQAIDAELQEITHFLDQRDRSREPIGTS